MRNYNINSSIGSIKMWHEIRLAAGIVGAIALLGCALHYVVWVISCKVVTGKWFKINPWD